MMIMVVVVVVLLLLLIIIIIIIIIMNKQWCNLVELKDKGTEDRQALLSQLGILCCVIHKEYLKGSFYCSLF
jgi:hypothetical protein